MRGVLVNDDERVLALGDDVGRMHLRPRRAERMSGRMARRLTGLGAGVAEIGHGRLPLRGVGHLARGGKAASPAIRLEPRERARAYRPRCPLPGFRRKSA